MPVSTKASSAPRRRLAKYSGCEVLSDDATRALYATDASIYQITPQAVAFPKTAEQAAQVVVAAGYEGLAVTPRGAGTGLAGAALGDGVVVDCARHNKRITQLDLEAKTVHVGSGVVLDQLNRYLAPHGYRFGPDVATSSRATLGGMIANNSSGAHNPYYGVTSDHVRAIDMVLASGEQVQLRRRGNGLGERAHAIRGILKAYAPEIRTRLHGAIKKRWPGYGIDRALANDHDLTRIVGGSEGTLGMIWGATLALSPLPKAKGLGIVFFASVEEAMEASVEVLELGPAAVEHVDDVVFDQTRNQVYFRTARQFLELDSKPCAAYLMVEFFENVDEKLAALENKRLGLRTKRCTTPADMAAVWELRKAGLSLLVGRAGDAKPVAGIEDAAVDPRQLPDYVRALRAIMEPLGLHASFYGHAGSGLLHVRPIVDLHDADDLAKFRKLADEVSAVVQQFRGALCAEHGVGIARTEYMADHLGPELLDAMRKIKAVLDPEGRMNPGKIFGDRPYRIDNDLRQGADSKIPLWFEPEIRFVAKDKSFVGNLEQCNGSGACRKLTPSMCPTFPPTGEEGMSTRGRANIIRAVLERRVDTGDHPLRSPALDYALTYCLSCKACATECPSNVNLPLLKAELLHQKHREFGVPLHVRALSRPDLLGWAASKAPAIANVALAEPIVRRGMAWLLGIDMRRELPRYAERPFHLWFRSRPEHIGRRRERVLLWDDCFTRYNDPHIGEVALELLQRLGFDVRLVEGRACCGRPAFSNGQLDVARALAAHNAQVLSGSKERIVFLEPSCYSMFHDDYRELGVIGGTALRRRAVLFEDLAAECLRGDPSALEFAAEPSQVAIHTHCHAKALGSENTAIGLARALPEQSVQVLQAGCCGMAGAYGMRSDLYAFSKQIARPLIDQIDALPIDAPVVASGTSCRHQIGSMCARKPLHFAEWMASRIAG